MNDRFFFDVWIIVQIILLKKLMIINDTLFITFDYEKLVYFYFYHSTSLIV